MLDIKSSLRDINIYNKLIIYHIFQKINNIQQIMKGIIIIEI